MTATRAKLLSMTMTGKILLVAPLLLSGCIAFAAAPVAPPAADATAAGTPATVPARPMTTITWKPAREGGAEDAGPSAEAGPGGATEPRAVARSATRSATSLAVRSLATHVDRMSDPGALQAAFNAYYSYRAAHPDQVRKPYFYYIDLGLDNATPRGYVFDMDALRLVEGPFPVAHGRGSLRERNGVPTTFSNRPGSNASSLGLYLAEETYTFSGSAGRTRYTSVGLRMRGESGAFNDAARRRGIVAHGAPYVTARDAGRSEGCPAMEQQRARRLLPLLADGGVVFIYSPHDEYWLRADPWVNAG